MDADLKRLRLKRGQLKGAITRIESFVSDSSAFASAGAEMLKARMDKLVSTYIEYEEINLDILSLDESDKEDVSETECKYFSALSKFKESMKLKCKNDTVEPSNLSSSKLPNIEISSFDGKDFTGFKPFMDLFNAVIEKNKSLSDVQKLCYLRKYLSGDALAVIINLPIVIDSYPEAMSLLQKRFDNKTRLVANHVNLLLDLPQMQKGTATAIRSFVSDIRQQLHALKNLEQPIGMWDMLLISILSRKLDGYTHRAYHLDRTTPDSLPTIDEFLSFLEKRAIALEDSPPHNNSSEGAKPKTNNFYKVNNVVIKPKQNICSFCSNNHMLFACPKFKMAPVGDRIKFVDANKLCTTCLRAHSDECKFTFRCKDCKEDHNTLLHQTIPKDDPVNTALHSNSNAHTNVLLPTIKVKLIDKNGKEIYVKALLDSGSQASIVKRSLVNQLNLQPMSQSTNIVGLGNNNNKINEYVKIMLPSSIYDVKFDVKCHVVDSITSNLPQNYIDVKKVVIPKNIMLADTEFNVPSDIPMLLGADFYFKVLLGGLVKLNDNLVLQNTLYGYIVAGSVPCKLSSYVSNVNLVSNFIMKESENNLENIMENFWLSEKLPEVKNSQSLEFQKAEECFKNSVKYENNKFSVDIPLNCPIDELTIGDSFSLALQRFYSLEKKFQSNPDYFSQYKDFIEEYVKLGHAKIVDISQYDVNNDPVYFLAHHAVLNESSKTTKLRVVFSGNMKSKSGVSINDVMLNGPIVQNELFDILLLFRTYRYTLMCDIEKCFRMCSINEKYKPLQNILWRSDASKPIVCLQLQTVTYGLKASTFLSTRCLIELAQLYQDRYPLAAEAIKLHTYVDDVICGADSVDQIENLKKELIELMKLGSFNLHKWCSNSVESLQDIPENKKYFEQIDLNKDNIIKTLGLKYNVLTDSLLFQCPTTDENLKTKRSILSFIGKMYDPLGLIGPVIVKAKLFMQELWNLKLHWDIILPPNQLHKWQKFMTELGQTGIIHVPRGIVKGNIVSVELVGYCDASFSALGCCLYLRALYGNGQVYVNLICSKSRVAPLNKTLTIPNLELNAAVLLAELSSRVNKTLLSRYSTLKVVLYSDSQIVLSWLKSTKSQGIYVSNRVRKIQGLTKEFQWSYVKSGDNPADLLSRGFSPEKLQANQLWWHGPVYLLDKNYKHDVIASNFEIPPKGFSESSPVLTINVGAQELDSDPTNIFKRYSNFDKLQRIVALILRFRHNTLKPNNKTFGNLTPIELEKSNLIILRYIQKEAFSKEVDLLLKDKQIKSNLSGLHPFLDKNNILRVGGRLQNAKNLSYDKKHPIILPKSNNITHMIIRKEHMRLLHGGAKLVLSSLSQKFWLLNGIREVKKVVHKCIKCFRFKAIAAKQLMGSLPSPRITPSRAFQISGVDFCGPFEIKVARIRKPLHKKCYIALFVCFTTKAVHAELVSDMTTAAFLACLQRFISRRGMPTFIYCDNAQTFKGASNQLKELYNLHCSKSHVESVENFCSTNLIKFKFIPSYSPEFGGLWEAGVKSIKFHIKRVVGETVLTFEELYTVVTQIEGILNSRPLLPLSRDISDLNYLTPAHFLIGAPITSYPELDLTDKNVNRLKFWEICSKLKQEFWKLWSRDYLTMLQNRPKWKHDNIDLKEGDLVIIKQKDISPFQWPMGRIVKTFPGPDGHVRVAELRVGSKNKTFIRSYTKLCPLPLRDD